MHRSDIRHSLCRLFCKYYKPARKEELACGGLLVIEKLILRGKKIPFDTFKEKMRPSTQEKLIPVLCVLCPFYEDDCDFIQQRESPPCGGFLLLGHLLQEGVISIDNIKDVG